MIVLIPDIDMVKLYFTSSFYTKITQDLFFFFSISAVCSFIKVLIIWMKLWVVAYQRWKTKEWSRCVIPKVLAVAYGNSRLKFLKVTVQKEFHKNCHN